MKVIGESVTGVCGGFAACLLILVLGTAGSAQTVDASSAAAPDTGAESDLRVEKLQVAGGAELITIFARQSSFGNNQKSSSEMPLVSIVKDTLGDDRPENDRMRFLYMLTYTRSSFRQKAAAFVPFLYTRTTNHNKLGTAPPPILADMNSPRSGMWNKVLWLAFKRAVLGEMGMGTRSSAMQYRENLLQYRRSSVAAALAVLTLYQKTEGEKLFTDQELRDIQARLWLRDKPLGALMQPENLERVYEKNVAQLEDNRGHNWELLRQYAEAEGLYFEPLTMADGSATHAIVWIAKEDLGANRDRKFVKRFLNIKDPWTDRDLAKWDGYTQTRWFDNDNRVVEDESRKMYSRTMIPLAVYGLDTHKIPGLLIDFRDRRNAKRREMSRRVLNDITGNVFSVSQFSSVPYLLGRFVYDFATGRRGADINQASRVRSYAQLKMLLALDASLDPELRGELARRIEDVSINPLENDLEVEANIARTQYRNLVEYANRSDGLPAQLDRDRREEMVRLAHSGKKRFWFDIARIATFGAYTHREKATPELIAMMDKRRELEFHERVINETAKRSTRPEIDADVAQLKRALAFVSDNGSPARDKTARSLARIFTLAGDDDTRRLCLTALFRIDNSTAKNELLAIYKDGRIETQWRDLSAQYLKQSVAEGKRVSSRTEKAVAAMAIN